jgi:hypothetical protein
MQPDLKKLISVFLGVALLASVSSFAFMRLNTSSNVDTAERSIAKKGAFEKNAFADVSLVTPPWRTSQGISSSTNGAFVPSSNLTENYSQVLSSEFMSATTKAGQVNEVALAKAVNSVRDRAFEEVIIPSTDIKINESASLEDAAAYIQKVRDILLSKDQDFMPKDADPIKPDPSQLVGVKDFYKKKREAVASLSVPKVMVPAHRSLLSFLAGYENFFDSLANYESDPLKALLAIQNRDQIIDGYTAALATELEKIGPAIKVSYLDQSIAQSMADSVTSLFFINKAQATGLPTVDVAQIATIISQTVTEVGKWAKQEASNIKREIMEAWEKTDSTRKWIQTQLEWIEKLATEQLKNVLVQLMVRISVAWINGDGWPKFVTNWRVYADNAWTLGVRKGFDEVADEACGTFGPSMMERLNGAYNTYYMPSNCNKSPRGKALDTFRQNSFFDGGWDAYGYAISPKGNYFHSYVDYSTRIEESAEKEREAALNDAKAGSGFTPTKNCPETTTPPEPNQSPTEEPNQSQAPPAPNPDGSCPDGSEPQNTTPGTVIQAVAQKAFTIPGDRIVNAENLVALSLTLVNGALSGAISAKQGGLTSLNNAASISAGRPSDTVNPTGMCDGFASSTPEYQSCMNNAGAVGTIQTDLDAQRITIETDAYASGATDNLKNEAQSISQNVSAIYPKNAESLLTIQGLLGLGSSEETSLDKVIQVCSTPIFPQIFTTPQQQARVSEANSLKTSLTSLKQSIGLVHVENPDVMLSDLSVLSRATDPTQVTNLFNQFKTTYGTLASTTALFPISQSRLTAVREIKNQTESNLANICGTPFNTATIPTLLQNP